MGVRVGCVADLEFWRGLQEEVGAWSARNYRKSIGRPEDPLAGLVEELGELAEAVLKRDPAGAVDAVADSMIYLCDFCAKSGLDISALVIGSLEDDQEGPDDTFVDKPFAFATQVLIALGRAHHAFLKNRQGVRTTEDHAGELRRQLTRIVAILWDVHDEVRQDRELPFEASVRMTWEQVVRKRDWVKDPQHGGQA